MTLLKLYKRVILCNRQRPSASDVFGVRKGPGLVRKPPNGKPLGGGHFGSALIHESIKIRLPHSISYPTPNLDSFQPTLPNEALNCFWANFEDCSHFFNRVHSFRLPRHYSDPFDM